MFYNENWSEDVKLKVWAKAKEVPGYNSNIYRKDFAGAWIKYEDYIQILVGKLTINVQYQKEVVMT